MDHFNIDIFKRNQISNPKDTRVLWGINNVAFWEEYIGPGLENCQISKL